MKDLVIYCIRNEKIIRISEGDGCNLSQEDIDNGYVDYLYYDIFDTQDLQNVEDGGMILLKKPIKEEFNCVGDVIRRVHDFAFSEYQHIYYLSGVDEWQAYVSKKED